MARLRKGKPRPPEKISVSILRSDHDYLADAIAGTDKPLYEVIHSRLVTESVMKGEYNEKIEYYEKALNEAHNSLRTYSRFIEFKELNEELFQFAKKQNSSLQYSGIWIGLAS